MRYTENELRTLFQNPYNRKDWTAFLQGFLEGCRLRSVPEEFYASENEKGFFLGEFNTSDHYRIGLFQFDVKAASVARKRVGLRNLVKSLINPRWGDFEAALVVFVSESDWRLSFICDISEEKTAPKRFTYVFGDAGMLYRTPVKRLFEIQGKVTFDSLKNAFSVEKVSKEFFLEYRDIYADFVQYITGNRYVKKTQGSGYELKSFPGEPQNMTFYKALGEDDKRARDFVKKMMGRITFLYFLQQKGWMCGDKNYMFHLFESSTDKDFFLKKVLVPLFFGVLNTKPEERKDVFAAHNWNDELRKAWDSIPYLNGGLFEPDEEDRVVDACATHIFRKKDFEELFEFFSHYNFTIDENDPSDAEVGVDPEMLGKIFESLLEDNKDKGAFYTPKEIVQYMCQESLVAYLVTKTGLEEANLRRFVHNPEECVSEYSEKEQLDILDGILNVKICDPAIGSGAFPIGLLNELVRCKEAIYGDKKGRADIKREIIRDNIYGVDIEKGAVDIARLRFWLSLVVDEDTPSPLPNLDYKIMQGNSLLEWYDGVDLSKLTDLSGSDDLFGTGRAEELKEELAKLLKKYFDVSDHKKKASLKKAISETITEILSIAGVEIPEDIDISENNQFFLWHTWFNEVFSNNGGFDICIGNPPYIRVQNLDYKLIDSLKRLYKTAYKRLDISLCFIEKSSEIISYSGTTCFISSNQFMTTEYGEKMRDFIINSYPIRKCLDYGDLPIFEEAMTYVSIMCFGHVKQDILQYIPVEHIDAVRKSQYANPILISYSNLSSANWNLRSSEKNQVFKAMDANSVPLKAIGHCNAGLITGCDEVLMFSDEDLGNLPFEKDILLPVLRADNCNKYCATRAHKYVIYPYKQIQGKTVLLSESEIQERFPKAYNYLLKNRDVLSSRKDSRQTMAEKGAWYGLVRFGRLDMFQEEKIISPGEVDQHKFCLDSSGAGFSCARVFAITIDDKNYPIKYVLAILNSNILRDYIHSIASLKSGGYYQYSSNILNRCPIPYATENQKALIVKLVDEIQKIKKINPSADTSAQEKAIDNLVYDLYGVPPEERK